MYTTEPVAPADAGEELALALWQHAGGIADAAAEIADDFDGLPGLDPLQGLPPLELAGLAVDAGRLAGDLRAFRARLRAALDA